MFHSFCPVSCFYFFHFDFDKMKLSNFTFCMGALVKQYLALNLITIMRLN